MTKDMKKGKGDAKVTQIQWKNGVRQKGKNAKPQSGDAKKMKNVNEMQEFPALSWSTKEEEVEESYSVESIDHTISNQDLVAFLAVREKTEGWITSIRTLAWQVPLNPSPYPMQQLASNPGMHESSR